MVEAHLGLARHIARRYSAGRPDDDLEQVARLALIDAVDGFDPARGVAFSSYAGITIEGAIKRHVSRAAWPVAVPRRVKSLAVGLDAAREGLEQRLGRSPTVAELAGEAGASPDDVIEALAARATRSPAVVDDEVATVQAPGGSERDDLAVVDDDLMLADLLGRLAPTERRIVELSFIDGLTQREVAGAIGVSQMQVSRVLRRSIDRLRRLST